MKRYLILGFTIFFFFIAFSVSAAEKIISFNATIGVNRDATIDVAEEIVYDFGFEKRHGIYRDIPFKYKTDLGKYNLRISNITVTDENENPYMFSVSNKGKGKNIKIGNPKMFISGKHTYVISYQIDRAITFFDDYDELYWNVTGNDWPVGIGQASSQVTLPLIKSDSQVEISCTTGPTGSQMKCDFADIDNESTITFRQRDILPNEGMTISVKMPKGLVIEPSVTEKVWGFVLSNWAVGIPFFIFILMYYLWYTRGRDPRGRGTIITRYTPPKGLTPSEVGTIIDETAQNKDISADIINLAIRGYLKIEQVGEKKVFSSDLDYIFYQYKKSDSSLKMFERELLDGLFEAGLSTTEKDALKQVKLSDLKDKFYKTMQRVKKEVYNSVVKGGYFTSHPQLTRTMWMAVGIFILVGAFLLSRSFGFGVYALSVMTSGIIVIIFGFFMPKRTYRGVLIREHILGLKEYLEVAEKDRIKFHNAPEKKPEVFEVLLPYAMALGVEKEWAKQFEDIYAQQPDWYSGPSGSHFNSTVFVSSLGSFSTKANSALSSSPSSGSSGGGFSGGGFGGGGGGSW